MIMSWILTSFFKFEIKDPLEKAEKAEEPKPEFNP